MYRYQNYSADKVGDQGCYIAFKISILGSGCMSEPALTLLSRRVQERPKYLSGRL